MDYKKACNMLNVLLSVVEVGDVKLDGEEPHIRQGIAEYALTFRGLDNVKVFNNTVEFLWENDKELFDSISMKKMQDNIFELIRNNINEDKEFTKDDVKGMIKSIKNVPLQTFEVLYFLYGVRFTKGQPLEVGPYTIYNTTIHKKHLLEKYPYSKSTLEYDLDEIQSGSNVIIGVCESARDSSRANEKALIRLRQFEDTIRFIIADPEKNYDVGIFNFNAAKRTSAVLLSKESTGSSSKLSGVIDEIHLNNFPISAPEYGHDRLWNMLDKENPTKLEKRIIVAIGWTGKALRDEEPPRSLTQYVFALEALLQFQQKNSMVSPSITYQMAEFAAFIISDDLRGRMKVEKMIKEIYSKRSAIAHGGSNEVSDKVLFEALHLIKQLITTLICNDKFKEFNTIEDVSEWVKTQKFT